jgi:hypothetical protein
MRRTALALMASVVFHGALVAGAVGWAAWRGWSGRPKVELVAISLEEIKELPLGPPPSDRAGRAESTEVVAPRRRPRPRVPNAGTVAVGGPDAGADSKEQLAAATPDAGAPPGEGAPGKKGDLRGYGPEGSRLTALLRLDRLRAAPDGKAYIGPVDELLRILPDRRLLDGTGLDLYKDFDALLIATPNPFDDTVTFLAARHHVGDEKMRQALDRGAQAGGRPFEWREEGGRPVAVRMAPPGGAPQRDDRIVLLPQTGLAVIAPPAYGRLLLERSAPASGGAADAGSPAAPRKRDWTDLVARIDAEDGSMPENAVLMMTATNLLKTASAAGRRGGLVIPGNEGTGDDAGGVVPPGAPAPLPRVLSLVAGMTPTPFLELTGEFGAAGHAEAWEARWPVWRQQLLGNPLLLLSGLNPIVARADLERDGKVVVLRTTATAEETRRILQMIVNFARPPGR